MLFIKGKYINELREYSTLSLDPLYIGSKGYHFPPEFAVNFSAVSLITIELQILYNVSKGLPSTTMFTAADLAKIKP